MQTITRTTAIEQMLESADHLIERHREGTGRRDRVLATPHVPEGWILYSACYKLEGTEKGWRVELMDTMRPFQAGSIVDACHSASLDAALIEANRKIPASRVAGGA